MNLSPSKRNIYNNMHNDNVDEEIEIIIANKNEIAEYRNENEITEYRNANEFTGYRNENENTNIEKYEF